MAYTATYDSADFIGMVYDLLGTTFVVVIDNIEIVVTFAIILIVLSGATKILKGTFNVFAWLK